MILQNKDLIMCPPKVSDLEFVHALLSRPETDRYNALGIPADAVASKAFLSDWIKAIQESPIQVYTFVLGRKSDQQSLGLIGVDLGKPKYRRGEVWFKIDPNYWGHGYATRALIQILEFCFVDLQLHRVEAGCAIDNLGSQRVLEKAGFIREGHARKVLPLKMGWSDIYNYGILLTDQR